MSLHAPLVYAIPEQTAQIARAAFPKGNPYMRMRDALGPIYTNPEFVPLFSKTGQPAEAPAHLALITIMQFAEGLADEQAADAVRGRIDWKDALALELTDPGFDASVLCEFRKRLIAGNAELLHAGADSADEDALGYVACHHEAAHDGGLAGINEAAGGDVDEALVGGVGAGIIDFGQGNAVAASGCHLHRVRSGLESDQERRILATRRQPESPEAVGRRIHFRGCGPIVILGNDLTLAVEELQARVGEGALHAECGEGWADGSHEHLLRARARDDETRY